MTYMTVKFDTDIAIIEPTTRRIDAAFATQFRADVLELKRKGYHKMILNLSNVDFIDSSGLGVVVYIGKMIGKREHLILCEIHPSVLNVLKLTKMEQALSLFTTEASAIEALQD
ncbi:MAG: STAS domain-containing protein [Moraxellaceae bacterium]|nr:STAS domain-containing protein [Moraxellaceae bacterium]MBK9186644.1 STAS domain-containing protein [Moraxellaceae bacterium]MBL0230406.1 STAS domain-containing protein [Moraxellaceae bacterium]